MRNTDHIDPLTGEIQKELDDTNVELRVQTERNDILIDEIYRVEAQRIKLNDMYKSQKKLIEKLKLKRDIWQMKLGHLINYMTE